MSVKTNGREWKLFYNDPNSWPSGRFHEDEEITVNGVIEEDIDLAGIPDDAIVLLGAGVVFDGDYSNEVDSVEGLFKKWRKKQNIAFLMVEVHKDKEKELRVLISASGGKVV